MSITPGSVYLETFVEGKIKMFTLPFPIFDLVHVLYCSSDPIQYILMNICLPEQLLPGNWTTDEENSCYPNSSLPGNCWYRSIISLHVTHAYLNIAQNI